MKTHNTDLASLLSGLLFVVVGIVVLAGGVGLDLLDLDAAWLGPTILIVLGVGVLLTAFDRNRDDDSQRPQDTAADRSQQDATTSWPQDTAALAPPAEAADPDDEPR